VQQQDGVIMKVPERDFLADRRRALEESFFAERDRQLLEQLRGELRDLEDQRQLAHVTGITEEKVLKDLIQAGIRPETLAAVRMIPLVEVAWCDGHVSPAERRAVLDAAAAIGIEPQTACHELLASWLSSRPDAQIVGAWKEYVAGLSRVMPADSMQALRDNLFRQLRAIASAAGGILGINRISATEQDTIDSLIRASQG
jgi:hypothetical protein